MSWERGKFRLNPEEGTTDQMLSDEIANQLALYPSTIRHDETGERLLSVAMTGGGRGLRLTVKQVGDLHDMLGAYLSHALPDPVEESVLDPDQPHAFQGVVAGVADRPCTLCGKADRHPIHWAKT